MRVLRLWLGRMLGAHPVVRRSSSGGSSNGGNSDGNNSGGG
jgi:hypothetical protein